MSHALHPKQDTRGLFLFLILLMALFAGMLVGCSPGPVSERGQLNVATDLYSVTVSALADYKAAGAIDQDDWERIEVVRLQARLTLNSWRDALDQGLTADHWRDTFNDALSKLIEARTQAEKRNE